MKYLRLYAGADGETHFEDIEVPMSPFARYQEAEPLRGSSPIGASDIRFFYAPATSGLWGAVHPAPRRQFAIWLQGEVELETSDGKRRWMGPRDIVLAEDTGGKGHRLHNVGGTDVVAAFVPLAE